MCWQSTPDHERHNDRLKLIHKLHHGLDQFSQLRGPVIDMIQWCLAEGNEAEGNQRIVYKLKCMIDVILRLLKEVTSQNRFCTEQLLYGATKNDGALRFMPVLSHKLPPGSMAVVV